MWREGKNGKEKLVGWTERRISVEEIKMFLDSKVRDDISE